MVPVLPGQPQQEVYPAAPQLPQYSQGSAVPPSQIDFSKIDPNTLAAAMMLLQRATAASANLATPATQQQITLPNGDTYVGDTQNGVPHGHGDITYANDKARKRYIGEFANGVPHGLGKMMYKDGVAYEGEFKDNERSGRGAQSWPNGRHYDGMWEKDTEHGQGTSKSAKGDVYIGEKTYGKRTGQGRYIIAGKLKNEQEGEWRDGNLWEGYSTYQYKDKGDIHEGKIHFVNGVARSDRRCTVL